MPADCTRTIDLATLLDYWLGDLPPEDEAAVEEHYFACPHCARRLQGLAALASGVHAAVHRGALRAVITPRFLDLMKRQGMRVREYRLAPGERVACTIRMEDDVVVGRMQVPLAGVTRVDLLERIDRGGGEVQHWRFQDVPFDAGAGELVAMPCAARLKKMPAHTLQVRLVAVEAGGERPLGEYTFAHSPS